MLYLASASPRRADILRMLGYSFEILPTRLDESGFSHLAPDQMVGALSVQKAGAVAASHPEDVVIGSDTIVVLGRRIFGKPKDTADAADMLRTLAGKTHRVYTGVCIAKGKTHTAFVTTADVTFHPMSENEISAYINTGEPMDKAGAYGIQGKGSVFIKTLTGDFFCVMGLPASATARVLAKYGIQAFPGAPESYAEV